MLRASLTKQNNLCLSTVSLFRPLADLIWEHLPKIVQNAKNSSSCMEKQLNGCWQPGCMLVLVVGSGLVGRDRKSGLGRDSG